MVIDGACLNQLRTFIAAADEGSFSAGWPSAEAIHTASDTAPL
jgi:hypothetical protein